MGASVLGKRVFPAPSVHHRRPLLPVSPRFV